MPRQKNRIDLVSEANGKISTNVCDVLNSWYYKCSALISKPDAHGIPNVDCTEKLTNNKEINKEVSIDMTTFHLMKRITYQ